MWFWQPAINDRNVTTQPSGESKQSTILGFSSESNVHIEFQRFYIRMATNSPPTSHRKKYPLKIGKSVFEASDRSSLVDRFKELKQLFSMVVETCSTTRRHMTEAAFRVSLSPLLPSSMEDETPPGRDEEKHVRFQPVFQPTHTVFTPRLSETSSLRYRKPDDRRIGSTSLAPPSSVSSIAQPNYDDFLRRVSVVLYQHIRRCEKRHREQQPRSHAPTGGIANVMVSSMSTLATSDDRLPTGFQSSPPTDETAVFDSDTVPPLSDSEGDDDLQERKTTTPSCRASPGLVDLPVEETFREEHFVTPQYKYTFVRVPRVHPMTVYRMEKITSKRHVPSVDEIFRFCKNLFNKAQLSAECTIVCLIYIERLMEQANVPLLAATWRPIVVCGLLLASKVWQDLSSWNVEISNIYPQFSLHSINRLERLFLHHIQWDLYISATVYAKYYFALRSLTEKKNFRRRYNYTMRVDPPNSKRLEERSAAVKNELYSKSL